jgi:hypothetical protein
MKLIGFSVFSVGKYQGNKPTMSIRLTYCVFQRIPDERRKRTLQPGLAQRLGRLVGGSVAGLRPTSGLSGHPPAPGRGRRSRRCRGCVQTRHHPHFAHMGFFNRLRVLNFL